MQSDQYQLHADVEDRHWWFLGRREIVGRLLHRLIPPSVPATVIDVGCGTGGNIAHFAQDYTCIGIDPSEEAIRLARNRYPDVRFILGSGVEIDACDDRTRVFLLMDVLEHVPDDAGFLSALVNRLRPGDHLLLTVPADASLWSEHDVSFGHYRRYDMARLEGVWSGLPVTTRMRSYFNARLYPAVKLVRALSRIRGRAWGKAGTDLRMPTPPINFLLKRIFAGEARRLVGLMEGRRARGYAFGVSLIALLRREKAEVS